MAMTLITTNTSSDAATSDFTTGIDSTYKLYIFKFININPATTGQDFGFQVNVAGESDYNEVITSTSFSAWHGEAGSGPSLAYDTAKDQAQDTGFQDLNSAQSSDADSGMAGTLWLFNPSNTTYVKHFYAVTTSFTLDATPNHNNYYIAGYVNVTGAIDEIQFKYSSGNFDGIISMYGVG
jgi:hypothetical protein